MYVYGAQFLARRALFLGFHPCLTPSQRSSQPASNSRAASYSTRNIWLGGLLPVSGVDGLLVVTYYPVAIFALFRFLLLSLFLSFSLCGRSFVVWGGATSAVFKTVGGKNPCRKKPNAKCQMRNAQCKTGGYLLTYDRRIRSVAASSKVQRVQKKKSLRMQLFSIEELNSTQSPSKLSYSLVFHDGAVVVVRW